MGKVRITRRELYDLVWSEPLLTLSKKYNISDNGLRKICRNMNIPLPEIGHWQKVRHKKDVQIKALPEDYSGQNEITLINTGDGGNLIDYSLYSKNALAKEIIENPNLPHIVPKRLSDPHRLIIEARNCLSNKAPGFNNPLRYTDPGMPNIRVSRSNIPRALRIIDAFFKLSNARGHEIIVEYQRVSIRVKDVDSDFEIREKLKKVKEVSQWGTHSLQPTGLLVFKIKGYRSREWQDGKTPIEKKLPHFLAAIEVRVHELKECWRENELRRKKEEEKLRKEQKERERQEKEFNDFYNLIEQANKWQQAKVLRDYLDEYEKRSSAINKAASEKNNWIQWARQKVERYDPLSGK